jgi:hypothetical protein
MEKARGVVFEMYQHLQKLSCSCRLLPMDDSRSVVSGDLRSVIGRIRAVHPRENDAHLKSFGAVKTHIIVCSTAPLFSVSRAHLILEEYK